MSSIRPFARPARRVLAVLGLAGLLSLGLAGVAAPGAAAASAAPAAPSAPSAPTAPTAHKPVPAPPPGVPTHVYVPKPRRAASAGSVIPYGLVWTVTLTSSCPSTSTLWATQYCVLTATTDGDVTQLEQDIQIYDEGNGSGPGTVIAACGTGKTCSVSVTAPLAAYHHYVAYVGICCADPPTGLLATSAPLTLFWRSVGSISFTSSATTRPLGASVTLAGSTDTDLGPTPFYFQIWDLTTKTLVAYCSSGTTCTTTVSQAAATTQAYQATIAPWSTAYPPPNIQMNSEAWWVAWSATAGTLAAWNVSISAPNLAYGSFTVTATANADVGPSPYDIVIYEEPGLGDGTGTLIRACGVGATCSVTIDPPTGMYNFVAFVASYSTTLPPVNAQAASSPTPTYQH